MTKEEIYHQECNKYLPDGIYPGMDRDKHLNAMSEFAKQEAIAFANWIDGQQLVCDLMTDDGEKHWVYMFPEIDGEERFTTEELYTLYLNQP